MQKNPHQVVTEVEKEPLSADPYANSFPVLSITLILSNISDKITCDSIAILGHDQQYSIVYTGLKPQWPNPTQVTHRSLGSDHYKPVISRR